MPDGVVMRQERKVVTALFADLVGSTALAEALDPEDVMDVVGQAVGRMVEITEDLGGMVKDLAGDGVLALFGAPSAHEDDAERAVRAGLRIVRELDALGRSLSQHLGSDGLSVRVGVATGLVVLGPVGGGHRVEYGAIGDTLNTASRLQTAAEPGSVLVDDATHRLAATMFDWRPAQDLELKGKGALVRAWPVVGMLPVHGVRRASTTRPAAMVGRQVELAAAMGAVRRVAEGGASTLVVVGGPGLGKTRLVEELQATGPDGLRWFAGRCSSYDERAYSSLESFLRAWLLLPGDRPQEDVDATLRARMDELFGGDPELEVYPYLAAMLGLTLRGPEAGRVADPSPAAIRHRFAVALARVVERIAEDGPHVIVVEDVHWCDQASLDVLRRLVDLLSAPGVGLVVTLRPEGPAHERLVEVLQSAGRAPTVVRLDPLAEDDQQQLLEELTGAGVLPGELGELLLRRAEGNPLFLGELVRSLHDTGALRREGDRVVFDRGTMLAVPDTVERVILSRIDRLPGAHHDVLTAGAVLGREFPVELLRAVVSVDADLGPVLRDLQDLELLTAVPGTSSFRFRHALVGEAAHASLLRRQRRELHRKAAEAIEALFAETLEEHTGTLARHWAEAGEPALAADCAERSGRRSCERLAYRDAVEELCLALDMLEAAGGDLARRGRLLEALGQAALRGAAFERAATAFSDAADVARERHDSALLGAAALGLEHAVIGTRRPRTPDDDPAIALLREALASLPPSSSTTARVLAALGRALGLAGVEEESRRLTTAAIDLARELGDDGALAYALLAWRTTQPGPDRLLKRLSGMDEMVAAAERSGDLEVLVEGERLRLIDRASTGDMRATAESHRRLHRTIRALGQPQYLWYPPMWQAAQAISQARFAEAERLCDEFRRIGRRLGYPNVDEVWTGQRFFIARDTGRTDDLAARVQRGTANPLLRMGYEALWALHLVEAGRLAEAGAAVERVAAALEPEPGDEQWQASLALLAEAAAGVPPGGAAERLYDLLLPWEGQLIVLRSAVACLGSTSHFLGRLARSTGRTALAAEHLTDAIDQNARTGMVGWGARSKVALADVRAALGDGDAARRLAEEATATARRTGMVPLAGQAARLLAALDRS